MTTASNDVATALIDGALAAFRSNKGWADKAVAQLPDDKLHVALDANTNCIAVIMKHVAGNMLSRWSDFLTTDGEKSWRNRDSEFETQFRGREDLLQRWNEGWDCFLAALDKLLPVDLERICYIRNEGHTVLEAINRQFGHYPYHVGQIVFAAKAL